MARWTPPDLLPPDVRTDPMEARRNGAAALSLGCAILWPIGFGGLLLTIALANGTALLDIVSTLTGLALTVAPLIGIVSGAIGVYRSFRSPALRGSRWVALVGLVLGCLWLAATFLVG